MRREQQDHQVDQFLAYFRKHGPDADFFAVFDRWASSKQFTAADRMAIGRLAHQRLQEPPPPTLTEIIERAGRSA